MVEGHGFDTPSDPMRVLRKAETVLQKRTKRLVVVIEKTVDVHNYSAVIRTAEALGVQDLYLIAPPVTLSPDGDSFVPFDPLSAANLKQKKRNKRKQDLWKADEDKAVRHQGYARTACKWINTHEFGTTRACVKKLKEEGFDLWVTDLGQKAVPLITGEGAMSLPPKLAIVFGTESTGCTQEMLSAADKRVYLPLSGFADSLNLSVAAAMVIQRLFFLEPSLEGDITDEEKGELRKIWYPCLARNEEQDKKYRAILASGEYPMPFEDMRRADDHREGWAQKKIVKKNNARYNMLAEKEDKEGKKEE